MKEEKESSTTKFGFIHKKENLLGAIRFFLFYFETTMPDEFQVNKSSERESLKVFLKNW